MPFYSLLWMMGGATRSLTKTSVILIYLGWRLLPFWLGAVGAIVFREHAYHAMLQAALWGTAGLLILRLKRQAHDRAARKLRGLGTARFAWPNEIRKAGLFKRQGLVLGRHLGRKLRFNRPGHLLTFAPTRSGKGAGGVIPNLLEHQGSAVVIDVKGENYAITRRDRAKRGDVYALAPMWAEEQTASYNPIDFVRIGTDHAAPDAALLADLLVCPHRDDGSYWDSEAQELIAAVILYVASEAPPTLRTLSQVADLVTDDAAGFAYLIERMKDAELPQVRRRAAAFDQKEERERSAVISTAQNHLAVWTSGHALAKATGHSDFSFEDLKRDTATVYIVMPPEMLRVYQSFLRVMIGLAVASMTRQSARPRHRVLFLLDEIAALGHVKVLEDAIGYLAGYGATLWMFFQDLDQLQKTYKKWRSIIANCAVRQAFNVADHQTAKELSQMLGVKTEKVDTEGRSAAFPLSLLPHSVHRGHSLSARPLLTEDEIMALPNGAQIIFVQGLRPILADKIRYFSPREWRYWGRWDRY